MNDNLTEIVVVLDKSSSMDMVAGEAISGFNAFLEGQKGGTSSAQGEARLTLLLFDTQFKLLYQGRPLAAVEKLTSTTYRPDGLTALWDAVGSTIDRVGKRLAATPEAERPGKVIFAILTDGEENSSRQYSGAQVRQMIEHQTTHYAWEFLYLSVGLDQFAAAHQAAAMGVAPQATYATNKHMPSAQSHTLNAYVHARRSGASREQAATSARGAWRESTEEE